MTRERPEICVKGGAATKTGPRSLADFEREWRERMMEGWSVIYPRAALTPAGGAAPLLGISLSVIGHFALVSIVPAWRAATADPLETMRT